MDREEIARRRDEIVRRDGAWWDNFELADGVWTRQASGMPNPRILRTVQIVEDLARKPLTECRILDLACADGHFALEFAMRGAAVVGVEGRETGIRKAVFAQEALGLENATFVCEDVRAVSVDRFGPFDIVLCLGILYHLPANALVDFLRTLAKMCSDLLLIDTLISLSSEACFTCEGRTYHGTLLREHLRGDTEEMKRDRPRASLRNDISFVLSRPSLVNLLSDVGFSSVYECFNPPVRGVRTRCTFLAVRGNRTKLKTFPSVGAAVPTPRWREDELAYSRESNVIRRISWAMREMLDRLGLLPAARSLRLRLRGLRQSRRRQHP
jgi:SAM-dependent methyltransferase